MNLLWDNFLKAKTIAKIALVNLSRIEPNYRYGLLTSFLLIIGFGAIKALNFENEIYIYPLLYFLFLTAGVYYTLWKLSSNGKSNSIDYFEGIESGLFTTAVAVILYSTVISFYFAFNREYVLTLHQNSLFTFFSNPFNAGLSLLFQGLAYGSIVTFCLMQYFKKN